jgi:hypothetical protein
MDGESDETVAVERLPKRIRENRIDQKRSKKRVDKKKATDERKTKQIR